jgi:hypothetical protein
MITWPTGWQGYFLSFMFSQIPGSDASRVLEMKKHLGWFYGRLAKASVPKASSPTWNSSQPDRRLSKVQLASDQLPLPAGDRPMCDFQRSFFRIGPVQVCLIALADRDFQACCSKVLAFDEAGVPRVRNLPTLRMIPLAFTATEPGRPAFSCSTPRR